MMMRNNKLLAVFSDWMSTGIFNALDSFNVPWKEENISDVLDTEYFGNISGAKTISPLVTKLLVADGSSVLSSARVAQLARVIYNLNGANWAREYATLDLEYNPINNYDMHESGTDIKDNTGTQGVTHTGTQVDADVISNSNNVYGFNSVSAVGDTTSSANDTNTRTNNLTDERTDDLSEVIDHTLTRSGNIGVTTSQQLIESERNLYLWNFFYKVVFPSVDKVLTIATYSDDYMPSVISSGGGGGDTNRIMEKLDEIDGKIDNITDDIGGLQTSIGLVNTNIDEMDISLTAEINAMESTLTAEINSTESSLTSELSSVESNITGLIGDVTTNNY